MSLAIPELASPLAQPIVRPIDLLDPFRERVSRRADAPPRCEKCGGLIGGRRPSALPQARYCPSCEIVDLGTKEDVVILGAGPLGQATGSRFDGGNARHLIGYMRFPDEPQGPKSSSAFLGSSDELDALLESTAVSEVFIAGNVVKQSAAMQRAISTCETYGIPFALPICCFALERAQPHSPQAADGYLHYGDGPPMPRQRGLKRAFDIVLAGAALGALAPLLAVTAGLIKLTSPGPVFFEQVRVGRHGKRFRMLKFRSMSADAESRRATLEGQNEQSGPVFKLRDDPRVTPVGRFIRKFSIDELPQLLNVLGGSMSLVGPRPPVPSEVVQYQPWQRRRLSVRPGLTCIWQVSGRNSISFDQWMHLDMKYIDHWSLTEDFRLILQTFPVVLSGRGAS